MRLKVVGGTLEVEVIEGALTIDDVRGLLRNLSKQQIEEIAKREKISSAGVSPHSSKSNQQNKLNANPRMPI